MRGIIYFSVVDRLNQDGILYPNQRGLRNSPSRKKKLDEFVTDLHDPLTPQKLEVQFFIDFAKVIRYCPAQPSRNPRLSIKHVPTDNQLDS